MLAKSPLGGLFMGMIFLVHYGGFCAVHGLFVLALTMDEMPPFLEGDEWPFFLIFVQLLFEVVRMVLAMAPREWLLAFAALFVSHGISLVVHYIRGGEHRAQDLGTLMTAPYGRIVVLHIAIIAGGFAVLAIGSPLPLLALLVLSKLGFDLWLHLKEHRLPVEMSGVSVCRCVGARMPLESPWLD